MRLLDAILAAQLKSVSVIGMAKNSGKTVTLNHLIEDANSRGVLLGLTSIGRDGERLDLVTQTEKPSIYVYENTLIATAESLFEGCSAQLEILYMSDEQTAMGRILVAKVHREGYVQLAGPSTTTGVQGIIAILRRYGAQLVLVDGALDRVSLASPAVTQASILASGAVLHRDIKTVIQKTAHRVTLLQCETIESETLGMLSIEEIMQYALDSRQIGLIDSDGSLCELRWLELKTALGAGKRIASDVVESTKFIIIPGGLVFSILEDYLNAKGTLKGVTWVVQDATKVFLQELEWRKLSKYGFTLRVVKPIRLIGLTINPMSTSGYAFDALEFKEAMQAQIPSVPVFDVQLEDSLWTF